MNEPMRLQKYMAECGVASRRSSEQMILDGRVRINGEIVRELGTKVLPDRDVVKVDGKVIKQEKKKYYIVLNKPSGYVTTASDPFSRPIVTDLVKQDISARLYPVGRLDYDTEGLLFLTNDGDFSNHIMHPKGQIEKRYEARISGILKPTEMRQLVTGVMLDGRKTAPAKVKVLRDFEKTCEVSITITEGRNHQVKKMFDAVGHKVLYLRRASIGKVKLGNLPLGKWRHMTEAEKESFR